jgi:thioredoxin reductase
VGGGNSAGQAAVFLSGTAKHVYLVMRGHASLRPCRDT